MILVRKYWVVNGNKGEAVKVNKELSSKTELEEYRDGLKIENPDKDIFFDYINDWEA